MAPCFLCWNNRRSRPGAIWFCFLDSGDNSGRLRREAIRRTDIVGDFLYREGLFNFDCLQNKPVALSGHCLYEAGLFRVIPQGLPQLADCGVDAVFAIDEDFTSPQACDDFQPGDEAALPRHQQNQKLHWQFFEFDCATVPAQLITVAVQFEFLELDHIERLGEADSVRDSIAQFQSFPAMALVSACYRFTKTSPSLHLGSIALKCLRPQSRLRAGQTG